MLLTETTVQRKAIGTAQQVCRLPMALVISADAPRLSQQVSAVERAGWQAMTARDAAEATRAFFRHAPQLAIVDLVGPGTDEAGIRDACEGLARRSGLLVIACGRAADAVEERWVRQVGVWMYLPAVKMDHGLSFVCEEARHVADRLSGTAGRGAGCRRSGRTFRAR